MTQSQTFWGEMAADMRLQRRRPRRGLRHMYTLPLGLFYFKSAHFTRYNLLFAGSMFNTIPILILFFIFQRYFIEGAVPSGVKG